MEQTRQPTALAIAAVAILLLGVLQLVTGGDGGAGSPTIDDEIGAADQPEAGDGTAAEEDGGSGDGGDGAAGGAGDGTTDGGDQPATGSGQADGGDGAGGTGADGGDASQDGTDGLTAPVPGSYTYASSGTWSSTEGDTTEDYQLPATATLEVTASGSDWQAELRAGERYADTFGFRIGADGGIDWDAWTLFRQFDSGDNSTTVYACDGDSAFHRADADPGRTASHGCRSTSPAVYTSQGTVEFVGTEQLTLGDGTSVTADRISYGYTLTNTPEAGFTATGEGTLELWLDPDTGLRLREQRVIRTDGSTSQVTFSYREDVEFLLQSLPPGA